MKLLWLTDLHLDHADANTRQTFYEKLGGAVFDAAIVTGDISISSLLATHLGELEQASAPRKVYFLLGNHDYHVTSHALLWGKDNTHSGPFKAYTLHTYDMALTHLDRETDIHSCPQVVHGKHRSSSFGMETQWLDAGYVALVDLDGTWGFFPARNRSSTLSSAVLRSIGPEIGGNSSRLECGNEFPVL